MVWIAPFARHVSDMLLARVWRVRNTVTASGRYGVGEVSVMGSQKMARRVRQTVRGSFAAWQRAAVLCIIVFAGLGLSVGSAFVSGVPSASAAPNAIQIENTQPGDSTWDDFSANLSQTALSGYSSPISVNHGQTVNFYVTTTSASVQIKIYRMGWYGGTGARLMETLGTYTGQQQP